MEDREVTVFNSQNMGNKNINAFLTEIDAAQDREARVKASEQRQKAMALVKEQEEKSINTFSGVGGGVKIGGDDANSDEEA